MMRRLFLVIVALGLGWGSARPCRGQATPAAFVHLGAAEGLSSPIVTEFWQDRQGFMWVGTQDGLNRFDGQRFRSWHTGDGGLRNAYIRSMAEDGNGYLWLATDYGLARYDPRTEGFVTYLPKRGRAGALPDTRVNAVAVSGQYLLVGTQSGGLCRLDLGAPTAQDPARATFTVWRPVPDGAGIGDTCILNLTPEPGSGRVWVGLRSGLQVLEAATGRFTTVPPPDGLKAWTVWEIALSPRTRHAWVASVQGLYDVDPVTRQATHRLADVPAPVYGVQVDAQGAVWAGVSGQGVLVLPPEGGLPRRYQHDAADPASLSEDEITTLLVDRAGSVWVATGTTWVSRFDPWRQALRGYTAPNGRSFRFGSAIRGMVPDGADGVWLASAEHGRLAHLNLQTGETTDVPMPPVPSGHLPDENAVNLMALDPQGRLWLNTVSRGPLRYDPHTRQWQVMQPVLDALGATGSGTPTGIDYDAQGRAWVGTKAGVICYDEAHGTARVWRRGPKALAAELVLGVRVDPRTQQVWVGTWGGGLNRIDPATGRVVQYPVDADRPSALPAPSVIDILPDAQGPGVWVASANGVFRGKSATGPFRRIDGLADNYVFQLARDPQGRIWAAGMQGFASIDGGSGAVRNYAFGSPLLQSPGCVRVTKEGQVLVGTSEGILGFFPDRLSRERMAPPVVITGVDVLNQPAVPGQALAADPRGPVPLPVAPAFAERLTLGPRQNVVTFAYAALNYAHTDRTRYRYRLAGFDPGWVEAGAKRAATYTNLPDGRYTFEVVALTDDGAPAAPARLAVRVLPPWYRTWWAYTLYALLAAAGVWLAARIWLSRQRNRLELALKAAETSRLAELDQIKTRFFTNISHEFRTPLTLIMGPLEKWRAAPPADERRRREEDAMRRNARRLLELINQLLDIAKLEAGSLRLEARPTDLAQLARALTYSFASLAETRGIELAFEAPADLPAVALDGDKFEKILTNLVANALKFTPEGGTVRVGVSRAADRAVVTVQDTGVGIAADRLPFVFDRFYQIDNSPTRAYEGTGIGLALVKELVALHGGTVTATSEEGRGTTFTVALPLEQAGVECGTGAHTQPEPVVTFLPPVAAEVAAEAPGEPLEGAADESLPLLLIVEDNADVRAYVHDQFGPEYRIMEAVDGQAGLEAAQAQVPDLVITDLMMPRMDGVELTRRLKTDERTSHIPVILLTAKAAIENRLEGLETGADDYLTKPFQPLELVARVRNLIEVRRRLRQKFSQEIREVREIKLNASEVVVTSADERFLQKALAAVEAKMGDEHFDVEEFASAMAMSRVQLYRKLKALADQTPTDFIRTLRLRRAAQLLRQQMGNVAEVAYAVGFQNLSYFAKTFKELHGVAPSDWYAQQVADKGAEPTPPDPLHG